LSTKRHAIAASTLTNGPQATQLLLAGLLDGKPALGLGASSCCCISNTNLMLLHLLRSAIRQGSTSSELWSVLRMLRDLRLHLLQLQTHLLLLQAQLLLLKVQLLLPKMQ
jgi:hypothetical protein